MPIRHSEVDAYIEAAAEFARPILKKIRRAFHLGCPGLQESIKWGCPHFEYNGIVGSMASFKKHASFGFWKSKLLSDPHGILRESRPGSMCTCRISTLSELPDVKIIAAYVAEAAELNKPGAEVDRPKPKRRPPLPVPRDLKAALSKNGSAAECFTGLSPSHRRDYIEWITEAKREATRSRRIESTLELLQQGKNRLGKVTKQKRTGGEQ